MIVAVIHWMGLVKMEAKEFNTELVVILGDMT